MPRENFIQNNLGWGGEKMKISNIERDGFYIMDQEGNTIRIGIEDFEILQLTIMIIKRWREQT